MILNMPESRQKILYNKRKKSGLCPCCGGKVKKSSPYKHCEECREYYRNYQKENTDAINEIRRSNYEQRKKENLCPRCGVFIGKKSKTTLCPKCLDRQYLIANGKKRPQKLSK